MAAVALAPHQGFPETKPTILLSEAWPIMKQYITMTTNHIERRPEREILVDEFEKIYRMFLAMVTQDSPHNYNSELYEKFLQSIWENIQSEVLPSLRTKHDELFLTEFVQRCSRYKSMSQCLFYMFLALDIYFIPYQPGLAPLQETSTAHFRDFVFQEVKEKLKYAIKALIKKECEGEPIDRDLLKNVLDIFVAIGFDNLECDFLKDATDSYLRSPHYFYNKDKSLEDVLSVLSAQLLVDEPSICFALFQDGKVNSLSRTYKLFKKNYNLPKLRKMFRMHLTNEVTDLLKKAGDPVSNKEVVLWEMDELYRKHVLYVTEYFEGDTLFLEALRESVSSCLTTQFFTTISDDFQKKYRNRNICHETKKISQAFKVTVNDKVTALIDEQRKCEFIKICNVEKILEGQKIRMAILKKVLDMLYSIEPKSYEKDFVVPFIDRIKGYYSKKAESLFYENFPDLDSYINWVDKYSMLEMERANHYLPFTNIKDRLLQEVVSELVATYFVALLRDEKVNDLSRMYIRYSEICGGLELISKTFKGYLKKEIKGLRNQENDSASNIQIFLWNIVVLVNKYEAYVTEIFQGHPSFHKALQKALSDIFKRGGVLAKKSGAEKLATFCIDILKEGCSEMPIEGALYKFIEGSLDKVVRLRAHITHKDHFDKICRNKLPTRLQTCFAFPFDAWDDDFICRTYRLFSKISIGQEPFIRLFETHLISDIEHNMQATGSVSNKEGFVQQIIKVLEKYEACIANFFLGDKLFHKVLDEVFEVFCNKDVSGSSVAELLATFCHDIMCSENLCNEGFEGHLDKVMRLLAYINDKILFAEFYRKNLARRLLLKQNANYEHETSMLSKLKQLYGFQITSQMGDMITGMEGMITDITVSRDNQTKFEEYVAAHPELNSGIDLSVSVLTKGLWPGYETFDIKLPAEMVKPMEIFMKFFKTTENRKQLTWLFSTGTCHICAKFQTKEIELIVTPLQAALLLLFNEYENLSYTEIVARLNLQDNVATPGLESLSCAEYKILNKEPDNGTISPNDLFMFNSNFCHEEGSIKILAPAYLKKEVVEKVDKDRKYAIDASIVRIMKSRKVMAHQQLVSECVEQLSRMFKPDEKAIKKRIEDLITREYLERDKDNTNVYKYLA